MARFRDYIPQGVIPAALLAFDDDFEINESETRRHFLYLSNVEGVTAITVNGHSSEVHACSHDEQSLILRLASETVGDYTPFINGIYADGSIEAARLAKMADNLGASALLCFPPNSMRMGGIQHRPEMALTHFKRIADATDLPLIVFQYGDELAYSLDTLIELVEEVPSIAAVKDWSVPQKHETHIRVLQSLPRPVNVLSTNSAWLLSSLVMGANGLLSGAGSVIAELQVKLFRAVQSNDLETAKELADSIWHTSGVFYKDPFGDMHNRMKEALVLLGRQNKAVVRPPLVKLKQTEVAMIAEALDAAGISSDESSRAAAE